jgi:hypothetical protein
LRQPREFGTHGELLVYGGGNCLFRDQQELEMNAQKIFIEAYNERLKTKFANFVKKMAEENARRRRLEKTSRKGLCVVS